MKPYAKTQWRGFTFNNKTVAALKWAEKRAGWALEIAQGSWNKGVGASAGTHDAGGVVDLKVRQYTPKQRKKVLRALKRAGFAAWYRREVPGLWGPHIHAVLINDPTAAPAAKAQVQSYLQGRDGLAGNNVDKSWRPRKPVVFNYKRNKPVKLK